MGVCGTSSDANSLALSTPHRSSPSNTLSSPASPRPGLRPSPISHLPVELLIQILSFVSASSPCRGQHDPVVLATVCTFWRTTVLTSPQIWQALYLSDAPPLSASRIQAELWLSRSAPLLLDVSIELLDEGSSSLLALAAPLLPDIGRIRHWRITGRRTEDVHLSAYLHGLNRPHVHHISIDLVDSEDDPTSFFIPGTTFAKLDPCPPDGLAMHVASCSLPSPIDLPTLSPASLSIAECMLDRTATPNTILDFLGACPTLESFAYRGLPQEPEDDIMEPVAVTRLPLLRMLTLRSTCAVGTLLAHLDTPALTFLALEHLNVEFQLVQQAGAAESASDEETDFSQSPGSDRATGIGLRTLLERSRPPLEVLHMDYADMRTQDFRWAFDCDLPTASSPPVNAGPGEGRRLETLKEFRIVASDMSDRVLALLAPRLVSETPERMSIALPRLEQLELVNCQQLSGTMLVAALSARARFTDACVNGVELPLVDMQTLLSVARLAQLSVVGCDGFTDAHAARLRDVVGGRLTT